MSAFLPASQGMRVRMSHRARRSTSLTTQAKSGVFSLFLLRPHRPACVPPSPRARGGDPSRRRPGRQVARARSRAFSEQRPPFPGTYTPPGLLSGCAPGRRHDKGCDHSRSRTFDGKCRRDGNSRDRRPGLNHTLDSPSQRLSRLPGPPASSPWLLPPTAPAETRTPARGLRASAGRQGDGDAAAPRLRPGPPRRVGAQKRKTCACPALPSGLRAPAAAQGGPSSATQRPAAPRAKAAGGRTAPGEPPPSWTGRRRGRRAGPGGGAERSGAGSGRGRAGWGAGPRGRSEGRRTREPAEGLRLQAERTAHARRRVTLRGGVKPGTLRFRH